MATAPGSRRLTTCALPRGAFWLTEGQRAAGWLGFEPAAEAEVVAAEQRLGVWFPPTYRNFVLAGNGWHWIGGLRDYPVDPLRTEEIGWFAEVEAELLDAWNDPGMPFHGGSGYCWLLYVDSAGQDGEQTAYEWAPCSGDDLEPHDDVAALATWVGSRRA